MVADFLLCRERAIAEQSNQDNRRKDYMEIMRLLWEEKGYASFGLTAQNLGSVKNAECGVWKMRSVENAGCGKRVVWKMRSVENAGCGKCVEISIFHFNM